MGKVFNTTGPCFPEIHYMVNIDGRVDEIAAKLVGKNQYFAINRARQYGKTTTLYRLAKHLSDFYIVFTISFEELGAESYRSESAFCSAFLGLLLNTIDFDGLTGIADTDVAEMREAVTAQDLSLQKLSTLIYRICRNAVRPIVLMIDEVDQASNNQIFLDFLGILRNMYLKRTQRKTFQSVILAGVYDIKNLKMKIRPDEEHRYNSPWNISANFDINMGFTQEEIAGMLYEYEQDYHTGMDVLAVSKLIFDYTSGYPFLVSRICQIVDEDIARDGVCSKAEAWTKKGILEAVKKLLSENNTLFDNMSKKLLDSKELSRMLYAILFSGVSFTYNPDDYVIGLGTMLGYLKDIEGTVAVSNRIFETRIYNRFISEGILESAIYNAASLEKNQFVQNGQLNVDLVMEKFYQHFEEIYGDSSDKFIEDNGRRNSWLPIWRITIWRKDIC